MINFAGTATKRTDGGVAAAAALIGCAVDALLADIQVEASSSGFDDERRPKALFEPHIFFRNLQGDKRSRAVAAGLAYSRWGAKPYPHDSYPRIAAAMAIDAEAALRSTSWGLPQILGENHVAAGYPSASAMVTAFVAGGEDEHLAAMAHFIVASPHMRAALVAKDWPSFARLYNGPATKGYDTRLAEAYAHLVGIHPGDLNDHLAASAIRASTKADEAVGATLAGGSVVAASLAAGTSLTWLVLGVAAAAIAVTMALLLRATAFTTKAATFATKGAPPVAPSNPPGGATAALAPSS